MSIKESYTIKSIDSYECHDWLLNKHYAKRIPPIEYSFGLLKFDLLVGVITFGTPVSNSLRNIFDGKYKILELNRLVVNEGLDKNCLSYFVSSSIKMLPKPTVLVSYADTAQNHHGYIYQATNWIYTGLSAKRTDYSVKGLEHLHGSTIYDMSRGKENRSKYLKEKFGDDLFITDRSRKHRYFMFLGSSSDIKEMKSKLPYNQEPYPKGENKRYDSSYEPKPQIKLF